MEVPAIEDEKNLEEAAEWDCFTELGTDKEAPLPSLLVNSPRTIMSSLNAPSDEVKTWKVRTNDLAVMEIIQERMEAMESGELKGRQLFEEFEGLININNGEDNEYEVRSMSVRSYDSSSSSSSSSSSCDSVAGVMCLGQRHRQRQLTMQGEKVKVKVKVVNHKRGLLVLVAAALIVFVVASIGRYGDEYYEVSLVPT